MCTRGYYVYQRILCVPEGIMCTRGYYVYQRILCVPEDIMCTSWENLKMLGKSKNVGYVLHRPYLGRTVLGPGYSFLGRTVLGPYYPSPSEFTHHLQNLPTPSEFHHLHNLPTPSLFLFPFSFFTMRVHIKDDNSLTPTFFKSARPPSLFC